MAFEKKKFQDSACPEDSLTVSEEYGRVVLESVVVFDHRTVVGVIEFSPKRARKVALALLAAADVAEGVEAENLAVPETLGLTRNGSVFVEHPECYMEEGAVAYLEAESQYLTKREAKAVALALLRFAR